jgi:hypothetical protein
MSTMTDTAVLLRRLHLSTHEGHTPGGLREPLIPADGDTYLGILCAEHLEACVPWVEVEFLLVPAYSRQASLLGQADLSQVILRKMLEGWCSPCAIRDVRLPVAAGAGAISIEYRQGVEEAVVGVLKIADGQDHGQLSCQLGKALQHRVAIKGPRQPKMILLLVLAEVGRLKQFLHSR